MKKLLSILVLFLCSIAYSTAANITIATKSGSSGTGTWSANSGSVTGTVPLPNDLGNISFSLPKTGSSDNNVGSTYVTWKKDETLTITMPTGVTLSAIKMTFSAQDKGPANSSKHDGNVSQNITCSLGTVTKDGSSTTVFNCSGTATNSITIKNTMGGEFRMTEIVITYAAGPVKAYTVTAASNNSNYGTAEAAASSLDEGETTTITATPKAGYEFTSWAVEGEGAELSSPTTNPTTLTMGTADATVTATFSASTLNITHNEASNGTYTISVAGGEATDANTTATIGQTITLAGTPAVPSFTEVVWNVKDANNNNVTVTNNQFTMPGSSVTISPVFSKPSIIKVTITGKTSATVSGSIGGTYDVSVASNNKLDKGRYVGFTLAGDNTFQAGDVININVNEVGDMDGTIVIYDSKEGTNALQETGTKGVVGDNKFVLNENIIGTNTIYICRPYIGEVDSNPWNSKLNYIEVVRPDATITLNANGFATYSSATDFEFAGADAYGLTLTTEALSSTKVTSGKVAAGEGILFKGTANATVSIINTTGAEEISDNDLMGTTPATGDAPAPDYTNHKYFVLKGNQFVPYQTASTFAANKAYFEVEKDFAPNSLDITFDDAPTAVEAVAEAKVNVNVPVKVIKNGQLVIETANGTFTAAGAQVK